MIKIFVADDVLIEEQPHPTPHLNLDQNFQHKKILNILFYMVLSIDQQLYLMHLLSINQTIQVVQSNGMKVMDLYQINNLVLLNLILILLIDRGVPKSKKLGEGGYLPSAVSQIQEIGDAGGV